MVVVIALFALLASGCVPANLDPVNWVEVKLVQWAAGQVMGLTAWLTSSLFTTPLWFLETSAFRDAYALMDLLATTAMVPIVAWVGLRLLAGERIEALFSTMGRLALAPILVKITPGLMRLGASTFDSLTRSMLSAMKGLQPFSGSSDAVSAEGGLVIFLIIYALLATRLILWYAYRNFALITMLALAPVVFVLSAIPGHRHALAKWVSDVSAFLTTQVCHALELLILAAIVTRAADNAQGFQGYLATLMLQIGGLQFMVRTPDWLRDLFATPPQVPNPIAEGYRALGPATRFLNSWRGASGSQTGSGTGSGGPGLGGGKGGSRPKAAGNGSRNGTP
jgi:hypothetical protein